MERRREALGRNRRGPQTRNFVPAFVALAALLLGLAWFAYDYFTAPQRVYGARALNCPATEISWSKPPTEIAFTYVISGCDKSTTAVCPPESQCSESDPLPPPF